MIGIIYGGIVAAVQRDLKRLVAYSSLAHMGFIVVGAFALTGEAVSGAVLQMVNHGLYTAALFLLDRDDLPAARHLPDRAARAACSTGRRCSPASSPS